MWYTKSIISLLLLITVNLCFLNRCHSTPLDDYVKAPDPHFNWTLVHTYHESDYVLYILNFTSQKWFDETFSNRPIWWHYLCVTVPHKLTRPNAAFMFIGGGFNHAGIPKPHDVSVSLTTMVAVGMGSIAIDLQDIPNQPIIFTADPKQQLRIEDAIIAWTWRTFVENPDNPYVLLRMPMTKASVRAMDAVQQFTRELGVTVPQKFMITGASKRGWTTWTTAAVDNERILAAAPIVLDLLNMHQNLHHLYRSLGGWSWAMNDYYVLNITKDVDNPNFPKMVQIIDPYSYLDRYKNMKLLQVQASSDEFFLPDNEDAFWSDLQTATGGSYIRRLPNADHTCVGHEISMISTIRSFFMSVYDNQTLPKFTWTKGLNSTHGYIRATVDFSVGPKPVGVFGYHATTLDDKRRDFRLLVGDPKDPVIPIPHPVVWLNIPVIIEQQTTTSIVYSLTIANPLSGWEGFYIQVNFPGPEGTALELTTNTQIIPDTYPTADCSGDSCYGTLV